MKIAASQIKRYKEIVRLLWKYGRSDLVRQLNADEGPERPEPENVEGVEPIPEQLADDLEAMGPTYIKLAQILASRPDLVPEKYLVALARLQDNVKPFSFEEVEKVITAELGVRLSKAFSFFERKPIAAASLGQVHLARLRDGRPVVVKVQRPDIQDQIAQDFEVLASIAGFLDAHTETGRRHRFLTVLEEFKIAIQQELDYAREAENLRVLGENLKDFERIQIPRPVSDYSTHRVLTMDYIEGRKITALSPLVRLDLEGHSLAEELFTAYLKQVLVDGVFHADPHPGNVFLTEDNRIALLDLGMVGHTTPAMQENLLKLLLAIADNDSETAADVVVRISQQRDEFDRMEFIRLVRQVMAAQQNGGLQQLDIGKSLLEVSRSAADNGLFIPSELALLGKTLLQLDEVGRILDPAFDPNASVRRNIFGLVSQRMRKNTTPAGVLHSLINTKQFMTALPAHLTKIMDSLANAEFEVKVKTMDAGVVVEGIQKVANRITAGIILAALIVGAALLMRVQTDFRIFGYPGLAILCFLGAAGGGFFLLMTILLQDRRQHRKK
ncbi:MAG TPA: AarF/UbiB family protein [Verrucomicrobiae bacterium]|jgi:ubiquinone biosynthesis protein|nr:AarF/UbiB family protein [Verrucomicrobiae bacterium]